MFYKIIKLKLNKAISNTRETRKKKSNQQEIS